MLDTFFTEKDFSDEDDDADVDNVPGLEFRIPRDRVISLRDNLLNLVSHYFNRHEGTLSILYILHYLINIRSQIQAVGRGVVSKTVIKTLMIVRGCLTNLECCPDLLAQSEHL